MKARILLSHRARRVFFFIHLWGGLLLGAWFSLIGVTGSVLTWRDELGAYELRRRFPVVQPESGTAMISLAQARDVLQKHHPDLDLSQVSSVTVPNSRAPFYAFSLGRDRRQMRNILVDPYRGEILGTTQPRTGIIATINQLHARLLGGVRSYVFNGFLTFLAIFLLLSGLWLWWPNNGKQLKARLTIKRGASLKRTLYDLHNVLGIYTYLILFATTLTGALLVGNHIARDGVAQTIAELKTGGAEAAPQGRRRGEGREGQGREGNREGNRAGRGENAARGAASGPAGRSGDRYSGPTVEVGSQKLSDDALLQAARQASPGYEITRLQLPQSPEHAFRASYSTGSGFAQNRTLYLDPYTGSVLPSETPNADYNAVVRGLHFGNFAGLPMKLIYTLTGLMPLGLFVTGLWMWARKKTTQAKSKAARHEREAFQNLPTERVTEPVSTV